MTLHITVAFGPGTRDVGPADAPAPSTVELAVDTEIVTTGVQLEAQLARLFGGVIFTVDGRCLQELQPHVVPLTSGAVVVADPRRAQPGRQTGRTSPVPPLLLAVLSGPDAGQLIALTRGTYQIGREGALFALQDAEVSRRHAVLTVGKDSITLTDLGSANGTWVDGRKIVHESVSTAASLRFGRSRCALVLGSRLQPPPARYDPSRPLVINRPAAPERNLLQILAAFLPLILGVILAMTTGMWFFLAFSALSAVTAIFPFAGGIQRRRRFRAAMRSAVEKDERRRRRAAPTPGHTALRCLQRGTAPQSTRPAVESAANHPFESPDGQYMLRLGTADQPAYVVVQPETSDWQAPVIPEAPVCLRRDELDGLSISGQPDACTGLVRSLLLQLADQPEDSTTESTPPAVTLCFGSPHELPVAARFLPSTVLVSDPQVLDHWLRRQRVTLFVLGCHLGAAEVLSRLQAEDDVPTPVVVWINSPVNRGAIREVSLTDSDGVLRCGDAVLSFAPDLLQSRAFERSARLLGRTCARAPDDPPSMAGCLTASPRQLSLISPTVHDIRQAWRQSAELDSLSAVIGWNRDGEQILDLVTDGPHILVAGTTGSGKSELLRSLLLGVALCHGPNKVNFLLIDFKGGSGLRPLADLPHSVGLLTDLSAENVVRALTSLRAEVKRRETLLQDAGAADLPSYQKYDGEGPTLPRLVVVIDEFRMLTEEVPDALPELMRLATLGRSLGIHLIMATQRPQGSISLDIRANITARIALRVQNKAESMDVIDSPAAASIPVSLPGRGYLQIGNAPSTEFHTTPVSGPASATYDSADQAAGVRPLNEFLEHGTSAGQGTGGRGRVDNTSAPTKHLDDTVSRVVKAAAEIPRKELHRRHRPLLDPLPRRLPLTETEQRAASRAEDGGTIHLGLLDLPERQEQPRLTWTPGRQSHLALVGTDDSGIDGVLFNVTRQLPELTPLNHLYILDGDSSLGGMASLEAVGTITGPGDPAHAVRVIQRLAREVTERISRPSVFPTGAPPLAGEPRPQIMVIVTGWERWVSVLRSGRWARAEDAFQEIIRDGEKAGVVVLITGNRDLLTSRFYALIPNRILLPAGSTTESLLSWPRLPPMERIPGRAFVHGRIGDDPGGVGQLVQASSPLLFPPRQTNGRSSAPFRIERLPLVVHAKDLRPSPDPIRGLAFAFGLTGDELETAHLELPQQSPYLIIGGPGSGKTNALRLLASQAPSGVTCLMPEDPSKVDFWADIELRHRSGNIPDGTVLLVDDADRLPAEALQRLSDLRFSCAAIVLTATSGHVLSSRGALASQARLSNTGMVLAPGSAADGDFFGRRLDVDSACPSGRAFQLTPGGIREVQIALHG